MGSVAFSYSLNEIVAVTGGQLLGNPLPRIKITSLLTDSRKLNLGHTTLFFALKTSKNDGHKYIGELIEKGVQCFVVSNPPTQKRWLEHNAFICVENTLDALQQLAAAHRRHFSCPVLGITGSNGKTIVKEWLAQLLSDKLTVVKNPRSYNSQLGVPLSVWQMDDTHQLAIFEAGISRRGEMEKLQRIIDPRWGIFTNIGPAHNEGFEDLESKILEKLKLFSHSQILIYHCDDPFLDQTIRHWSAKHPGTQLFGWGENPAAHLRIVSRHKSATGYTVSVAYKEAISHYTLPFTDEASFENALHCIAFLFSQNLDNGWLHNRLGRLQPLDMRMEMKQAIHNCLLVNDSYSSDILSLGIALDFLASQAQHKTRVLILSDILQSGMTPEKLYTQVAQLLHKNGIQHLIGIGPDISKHRNCFAGSTNYFFADTDAFLSDFDFSFFRDQAILLKGARDFEFERISRKLQLKDHQTLLEINLDALVHNLNVYRARLKPGVKVMAMVKAFSYGSGSYEIANVLQYHQVDYLAVAFADEGYELRQAGIRMPVMVLNPELHNLDVLFRQQLEPEIYSLPLLERIAAEASRFHAHSQNSPFPVHLKLDTGMHRLGFLEHELPQVLRVLAQTPSLKVASVFSHLAASDMEQFDDFTRRQFSCFEKMCHYLKTHLGYGFLQHICNSAGVSRFPEAHYDMVRLGIGLYGVDPSPQTTSWLQTVTTFKSVISQIKEIPAGSTVGYNRAARVQRDTMLAIVPVGYADGLSRRLGNGNGSLWVNGQKASITGNISMDMCTIDATGMTARPGDEVIIFGKEIPVTELAQKLETIPYEIFTSIPPRVKRVYYKE